MASQGINIKELAKDIHEFQRRLPLAIWNAGAGVQSKPIQKFPDSCNAVAPLLRGGEVFKQNDANYPSIVIMDVLTF